MSNFADAYEVTSKITEDGIDLLFMSEGKRDVVKIIRYAYFIHYQERDVFNLAFGDYYSRSRSFSDNIATNNGDPYSVYHTVLASIPYFFKIFEDAMLLVRGSDSTQKFQDECRLFCERKCSFEVCRKAHRRINIYRNYVNRHFDSINKEYMLLGSLTDYENQLLTEDYVRGKNYLSILLKKRKFIA